MTTPFEPTTRKRPGLFTRLRTSFLTGIVVLDVAFFLSDLLFKA